MGKEVPGKARVRLRELATLLSRRPTSVFARGHHPVVSRMGIGLLDGLLDVFPAGVHPNTYLPFAFLDSAQSSLLR